MKLRFPEPSRKLLLFIGLSCLVVMSFIGLKELGNAYEDRVERRQMEDLYLRAADLCLEKTSGESVPDRLRECAHRQTQYGVGEEFHAEWKDKPGMVQGVIDYMEGRRSDRKHYECSTRSGLLVGMLRAKGYRARDVITAKFLPEFNDHVVVEVWSEDAGDWEAHDPSHNTYFVDGGRGERLSVREMVTSGTAGFVPCFEDGRCGWQMTTDEGFSLTDTRAYWGNMVVKDADGQWQVVYNPEHFDPQKPLAGQSYCQKREKFCRKMPQSTAEPMKRGGVF